MTKILSPQKRTLLFINLIVSGIASSILSTAMTTALPQVISYFGVTTATGQWITSGYSLAMGMVMPLTAFLITKFPTKRLYLSGIGLFLAGLLLSIFAGNFPLMMVGRVMQACGNGVLLSSAQVIILTIYPPEKKGTMMGTYGLATTAAPVIAPTLAGLMIDAFGWKSIFSGSIGSAVFVSIFSTVSSASVAQYGNGAMIRGTHAAFGAMGLCAVLLALVAIVGTREKSVKDQSI
jgi:MFS family permease